VQADLAELKAVRQRGALLDEREWADVLSCRYRDAGFSL
jgi:hypothetical protein